jgi:hypothetical protein
MNIDAHVGFMLPRIWSSTFLRAGWDIEWLGPEIAWRERRMSFVPG